MGFTVRPLSYGGCRRVVPEGVEKLGGMSREYDLGPFGRVHGELSDNRKHAGVKTSFGFVDGDQLARCRVGKDRGQQEEAKRSIGKTGRRLSSLESAPTYAELDELIGGRGEDDFLIIDAESSPHCAVDCVLEIPVIGIQGMQDRNEIPSIRSDLGLKAGNSGIPNSSLTIDTKIMIYGPAVQELVEGQRLWGGKNGEKAFASMG